MKVHRIYVADRTWELGHYPIQRLRVIKWPLPKHRVYECIEIWDTTYIFLRASAFRPAPPTLRREGETP